MRTVKYRTRFSKGIAGDLTEVDEELGNGRAIQTELPHVLDDADDGPGLAAERIHGHAERIAAEDAAAHDGFVDEHDGRLSRAILIRETATGDDGDAHRAQIVLAHITRTRAIGRRARTRRRRRPARTPRRRRCSPQRHEAAILHRRQRARIPGLHHARHRAEPRGERFERGEPDDRIAAGFERGPEGDHVRHVVAGIDARELDEAVDQQAAADEEHHRHRDLRDHEQALQAQAVTEMDAGGRRGAAGAQRIEQRRAQAAKCRRDAEEHAGQHRQRYGEGQHRRVDTDFVESRDLHACLKVGARQTRAERAKQRNGDECERDARGATDQREQDALGQRLAHQTPARCAQCQPDGHLTLTRGACHEQKIRDVHARDQQNDRDRRC